MRDWLAFVQQRLPNLHISGARQLEIATELAQQLEQSYKQAIAGGATPAEAERAAARQFPDWAALAREIERSEARNNFVPETTKPGSIFHGLMHDLRHAVRLLRRNPAYALLAIATLAFGIGANSAIFTLVDTLALRPMPYPEPSRLAAIGSVEVRRITDAQWVSMLDFFDVRDRARSFSAMAGITPVWNDVVTINGTAQRL